MKKLLWCAMIIASLLVACEPQNEQGYEDNDPIENGGGDSSGEDGENGDGGNGDNSGDNSGDNGGDNGGTNEDSTDYADAILGHWWNVDSIYTDDDSLFFEERLSFHKDGTINFQSCRYVNDYEEEYECICNGKWSLSTTQQDVIDIYYDDVNVYCSEGKQEYCGFKDGTDKKCSYEIVDAYFDEDGEIVSRDYNVISIKFDDGNTKTFSLYSLNNCL